jgi:hypothetical protein
MTSVLVARSALPDTQVRRAALRSVAEPAPEAITESLTVVVDADQPTTLEALRRLDLAGSAGHPLRALAPAGRLVLAPTMLTAGEPESLAYGLVWQIAEGGPAAHVDSADFAAFAEPGYIKASWTLTLSPRATSGTLLTIRTSVVGTDLQAMQSLLDGWGIVGALASVLARRIAAAVTRSADEAAEARVAA